MRRPRHDVRNDGIGPYAVFYCEKCDREYRSSPAVGATIAQSTGRQLVGGLLRKVPLAGQALSNTLPDSRYVRDMTPTQLDTAWKQVESNFHECPTCLLAVCNSDWGAKSGYCKDCTPRREEIARAETEQAIGVLKGVASAFGIDQAAKAAMDAARADAAARAAAPSAAAPAQAASLTQMCASCGAMVAQGKFCPECGAKLEPPAPTKCPTCGAEAKGAKFCSECGTKII